jgi:ATP-dependent Zn protease
MVYRFGMGHSGILGNFLGSSYYFQNPLSISRELKNKLDNDVQKILTDCLNEVEEILTRERELFEYFAQELLKKEELEYDEIVEIFRKHGKERRQNPGS